MKNIVNYSDVGFGDTNIDFLSSPFDQIDNTSIVLNGFGNPEFASLESNTYFNNKNLNFGSINPALSKVLVKYDYEEIYEKSKVLIKKNSSEIVAIKNKNIHNPVFLCTANKQNIAADVVLFVEKLSASKFKITNSSSIDLLADYIASGVNIKKTAIYYNQLHIDKLNNVINKFLE